KAAAPPTLQGVSASPSLRPFVLRSPSLRGCVRLCSVHRPCVCSPSPCFDVLGRGECIAVLHSPSPCFAVLCL
ncbi:hypothetical protein SESBI_50545, partial [Sesbania bispinosa]